MGLYWLTGTCVGPACVWTRKWMYRQRGQHMLDSARSSLDPMVHHPAVLAWMTAICVQGDLLQSHLAKGPTPTLGDPLSVTASGESAGQPISLPRPHQGAAEGSLIGGQLEARPAEYKCTECSLCFADLAGMKLHLKRVHQMPQLPPEAGNFREHSVDGMPVCKFCHKDLKTWRNFCRHFSGRHCSSRWQAQHAAPLGEPDAPPELRSAAEGSTISPDPESRRRCTVETGRSDDSATTGGITAVQLIRSLNRPLHQWLDVLQESQIMEQLRHRCCICSQWIANIRSVKLHILKVHPDIYHSSGAAALADCRKVGHVTSPCRFCGMQVSKTSQHAGTCPVLWQLRLGALLARSDGSSTIESPAQDGSHGSRRSLPLRLPAATETHGPCRGAAQHGGKTDESVDLPGQGKRKRPGTLQTGPTLLQSNLGAWLRHGSHNQDAGTPGPAPRRLHRPDPERPYGSHHIQPGRRLTEHCAGPCRGGREVEHPEDERTQSHQSHPEAYPACFRLRHSPQAPIREGKHPACVQAGLADLRDGPATSGHGRGLPVELHDVARLEVAGGPGTGCRRRGPSRRR